MRTIVATRPGCQRQRLFKVNLRQRWLVELATGTFEKLRRHVFRRFSSPVWRPWPSPHPRLAQGRLQNAESTRVFSRVCNRRSLQPSRLILDNQRRPAMGDDKKRSGDRRTTKERRSGKDTRSEDEKRLTGERRSKVDRRSGQDRRAKPSDPPKTK